MPTHQITTIALACLMAGCASDNWSRTDSVYELAYVASITADAYTTTRIQYSSYASEQQPITRSILGARPSTSDTWQYFATLGISHYLISRALPEKWRRWWQVGGTAYHGYMAFGNCNSGLCSNYSAPSSCTHFEWRSDTDLWRCVD